MHFLQKAIAVSSLALSLGLAFSTAALAQPITPEQRQQNQESFTRRLEMFKTLEEGNDARLNELVRADTHLDNYYFMLRRAAGENNLNLTQKLLDLPALDRNSADFKKTVGGVYAGIAANAVATSPEMTALLFDRIKDDKAVKDDALRFIFETAAMFMGDTPNVDMTRRLVQSGADLQGAIASVTKKVLSNSDPLLQGFPEDRLARVEKLRSNLALSEKKTPVLHFQF